MVNCFRLPVFAALAALALTGSPVAANTQADVNAALRADSTVWNGLLVLGVAYHIGEECSTIDARTWRGRLFLLSLYNHARGLGYSRDQIEAFVDDEGEKERLRLAVQDYVRSRGAVEDDPETLCAVGREEIQADSAISDYLRAR